MQRLLSFAQATSAARPDRKVLDSYRAIQDHLLVSPAVMTNWKRRGISKEGALQAQKEIGCNAGWLLTGEGAQEAPSEVLLDQIIAACQLMNRAQRWQLLVVAKAYLSAPESAGVEVPLPT